MQCPICCEKVFTSWGSRFLRKLFTNRDNVHNTDSVEPCSAVSSKTRTDGHQNAYFNADIEENIYMEQPEGFEVENNEGNQVYCKLRKSLYGLKQFGRNWYLTLKTFLEGIGFRACINDKCLFVRDTGDELCCVCVCGWMIFFIGDDRIVLLNGWRRK